MTILKNLCCLLLFTLSLNAQEMEFRLGGNYNQFYHFPQEPSRFSSEYSGGFGGHLGIGLPSLKVHGNKGYNTFGIYLHYDYYQGMVNNSDGGGGGYYWTDVEAKKHILGLAFYPLNLELLQKRLRISLGPELAILLKDELVGTTGSNLMSVPLKQNVQETETKFSSTTRAGINAKIGTRLAIGKWGYLIPQYDFSWGLSKEFKNAQGNPKSQLHRLSIGWVKMIKE